MTDILEVASNMMFAAKKRGARPTEWMAGPWAYDELRSLDRLDARVHDEIWRRDGLTLLGLPVKWTDELPEREIALYAGDTRV